MHVMLFKSIHSIIAMHCDTRCINALKIVSIPVSQFCVLRYGDASMYHPISSSTISDCILSFTKNVVRWLSLNNSTITRARKLAKNNHVTTANRVLAPAYSSIST